MKRNILLTAASLLFSAGVAMAAPFSDVPASHWSYDAVHKLAAKGILQGYPDSTFKGEKVVTRYALGMVTAKLLAASEQMLSTGADGRLVTKEDLATLEKLTAEFADELALIGIKVTNVEDDMAIAKEDVALLKRDVEGIKDYVAKGGMEKVKLSGEMLVRHTNLIHRHDWATHPFTNLARAGNSDNSLTESLIGLTFTAHIDENIKAEAYWAMLDYNTVDVNGGQSGLQSAFGLGGIGAGKTTDSTIYIAYLEAKDMFRFGGDFIFGRNMYDHGHSLLLNNYIDSIRYSKKIGSVDMTLQTIFDRHRGSYKDSALVDSRGVWHLDLGTEYKKHKLYLGLYGQNEPNTSGFADRTTGVGLGNTVGLQSSDKRWDVEFGSKGPIGKSSHWDYDLGFAYTSYRIDVVKTAAAPWISPEMKGWMGHGAVKWDSKKQWAAKLGYTFADDKSMGAISINNDMRYMDAAETPYEDIARGNTWFASGLRNMGALKLQTEYRPKNTKHYFRLAGDLLNELEDITSNDLVKLQTHNTQAAYNTAVAANNATVGANSAYDRWNNFGTADAKAVVLTFEYRYQLAENTRIRVGYTSFDFGGNARKARGVIPVSAGRGFNNDFDYNMFWSEIYSQF